MRYYVYAPNGQRFGPADLPLLQQWVAEGRVLPTSMIEEEDSGIRLAASAIHGLTFPNQAPPQSPYGSPQPGNPSNYYRPGHQAPLLTPGVTEVNNAFICAAVAAFLCCGPVSIAGIVYANRAKALGNPSAQVALVICWIITALWSVGILFYLFAMIMVMSG